MQKEFGIEIVILLYPITNDVEHLVLSLVNIQEYLMHPNLWSTFWCPY